MTQEKYLHPKPTENNETHRTQERKKGVITRINGQGLLRKRLSEMGFIKGKTVEAVRYAPLGSPMVYRILNSEIAITPDIASLIEITKKELPL